METKPESETAHPIRVVATVALAQDEIEIILSCPITHQIYHTPVILIGSGYTLEKEEAIKLLKSDNPLCPITKLPFTSFEVNRGMMDIVRHYLERYPAARSDQYTPTITVDAPVVQAAPNNNQDLEAQALDLPELLAQPLLRAPNLAPVVGNAHNNDMQADEMIYMKSLCLGSESEQKFHFTMSLRDDVPGENYNLNLGDFIVLTQGNCRFRIFHTAGQERFRIINSKYYSDVNFVLIFANDALEDLDSWLSECIRYMHEPQLYWINSNAAVGQRLVACQELPHESIRHNRFPVLSKRNYAQVGLELLDEAKTLVLQNVNVNVAEPAAPQHPPAGGICTVM